MSLKLLKYQNPDNNITQYVKIHNVILMFKSLTHNWCHIVVNAVKWEKLSISCWFIEFWTKQPLQMYHNNNPHSSPSFQWCFWFVTVPAASPLSAVKPNQPSPFTILKVSDFSKVNMSCILQHSSSQKHLLSELPLLRALTSFGLLSPLCFSQGVNWTWSMLPHVCRAWRQQRVEANKTGKQ